MFFGSRKLRTYRCRALRTERSQDAVSSRQDLIPGFEQGVFSGLAIGEVGAGGLAGDIGEGLVRKGVGSLWMFDYDTVEPSNLNRQFFYEKDLYKYKALRLAKNLSKMGFLGTRIHGVALSFQQAIEEGYLQSMDVLVCGVDDEETRIDVCKYALQKNVPVVYTAVSRDGNNGYVFVQELGPGKPCYGCVFKGVIPGKDDTPKPCTPDPAIKDILKVVSGFVLYAVDSLFMPRKRNWNYREIFLAGFLEERLTVVRRRDDCRLCGPKGDDSGTGFEGRNKKNG